jgi:hypothetical protein
MVRASELLDKGCLDAVKTVRRECVKAKATKNSADCAAVAKRDKPECANVPPETFLYLAAACAGMRASAL